MEESLKEDLLGKIVKRVTILLLEVLVVFFIALAVIVLTGVGKARRAARVSASLSNSRQISLSILMYASDYNDRLPPAGRWGSDDSIAYQGYPGSWYSPWTILVEKYLKNLQIFESPLVGPTKPFTGPGSNGCAEERQCAMLYPTYGYNAVYLSPTYKAHGPMQPIRISEIVKPAEQVMLTEIWSRNYTSFGTLDTGPNDGYLNLATAEAPDGADPSPGHPRGRLSWGTYNSIVNSQIPSEEEGRYRAGVAARANGKIPTAFADGHVKAMTPGFLARGTDWVSGQTSMARNLKNGHYMWDPNGL